MAQSLGVAPGEVARMCAELPGASFGRLAEEPEYPHKHACRVLADTANRAERWGLDPAAWGNKTIELHVTNGHCGLRCRMCLWSDGASDAYSSALGSSPSALLTFEQWSRLLERLPSLGYRRIVVSGGGEPLLHRRLSELLSECHRLGLQTELYTSGDGLSRRLAELLDALLEVSRIRFSIHAASADTYAAVVQRPNGHRRYESLMDVVRELVRARDQRRSATKLGIGFVVQSDNVADVVPMLDLAAGLGLDFVDLRVDEVAVTSGLSAEELEGVRGLIAALTEVDGRSRWPDLHIDVSDRLVQEAFGVVAGVQRRGECFIKHLRPCVTPHGLLQPCDLKAEPRFANRALTLLDTATMLEMRQDELQTALDAQFVSDACLQCMPNSRTLNAVVRKLQSDNANGLIPSRQPIYRWLGASQ